MQTLFRNTLKMFMLLLLLMPVNQLMAQDDNSLNPTVNDDQTDKPKKKKDRDAEFYHFEVNKLSGMFFGRLLLNILTVLILVRFIYHAPTGSTEFFQTFFIFNFIIFLITYLLSKVDLSLGAAFGLFAVFSILRFRTEGLTARDMTYLFLVIALGLINAVAKGTILEMIIINGAVLLLCFGLEGNRLLKKRELTQVITYDNIEFVKPENYQLLIEDLKKKTGLPVTRISVNHLDFLKDSSELTIYYRNESK